MSDYAYRDVNTDELLTESDVYGLYDEVLNSFDGPVTVGGVTFDASRVLRQLDPVAYQVGFNDWVDSQLDAGVFAEH